MAIVIVKDNRVGPCVVTVRGTKKVTDGDKEIDAHFEERVEIVRGKKTRVSDVILDALKRSDEEILIVDEPKAEAEPAPEGQKEGDSHGDPEKQ